MFCDYFQAAMHKMHEDKMAEVDAAAIDGCEEFVIIIKIQRLNIKKRCQPSNEV